MRYGILTSQVRNAKEVIGDELAYSGGYCLLYISHRGINIMVLVTSQVRNAKEVKRSEDSKRCED